MPQQIQFVPQQFQVVPTNQHMIVNSQGQVHSLSTFRVYFKMVYSVYSRWYKLVCSSECIDLLIIVEWTFKGQALGQVQQQVQIINHGPVSNQNSQNGQTAMITQIQQSDHKVSWNSEYQTLYP